LKDIFIVLVDMIKYAKNEKIKIMYNYLIDFMIESKNTINKYRVENIPIYYIHRRVDFIYEEIFLERLIVNHNESFDWKKYTKNIFRKHEDIKDINDKHGNILESMVSSLNIAGECIELLSSGDVQDREVSEYINLTMKIHTDTVLEVLNKYYDYPIPPELCIKIAKCAICNNDIESAKKYYVKFVDSGVSVNHYSRYIRQWFLELQNALVV
jgi:hypothetical protein